MNYAQKGAWLCLIGGLMSVILISIIGFVLLTGFSSDNVLLIRCSSILAVLYTAFFLIVIRKKRKPQEPDADERDKQISLRAVRICLISLCLLIYFSDVVIMLFTGLGGWIPSSALPVIHFGVGYLALTIYYATVIILYGKDNKAADGGAL